MLDTMTIDARRELETLYGDLATNSGTDYTISDLRAYADQLLKATNALRTLTHDPDAGIQLQSAKHWILRCHAATASLVAQRQYRLTTT